MKSFEKIGGKILAGILSFAALVSPLSPAAGAMDHPETDATGFDDISQAFSTLVAYVPTLGQDRINKFEAIVSEVNEAKAADASVTEDFLADLHGIRVVNLRTQEGNDVTHTFDFDNLTISSVGHVPVSDTRQTMVEAFRRQPFFANDPQLAEFHTFLCRIPTDRPTVQETACNLNDGSLTLSVSEPPIGSCVLPFSYAVRENAKRILYIMYRQCEVVSHHVI